MTARNAPNDAATLARLTKDLAEEVERIHDLRRGRTTSKPWQDDLASQMPADIVTLRKALDEARDAISDLGAERHSLKNGQLSTAFLARFDGDTAAAIAGLPKLIEEAHANHKAAAAALDAKALDQARAENALIEGWLTTHREQLQTMRSEFAAAYERQQVHLARLHSNIVAIDPWKETSYCGVLLKIVDATLLLLDSERSMDNYMESDRLSRSFAHLTGAEWQDLTMHVRSEVAKLPAEPINEEAQSFKSTASHSTAAAAGSGSPDFDRDFQREQEDWLGPRPPDQILECLQQQAPDVALQIESSRAQWATLAVNLADMLALQNVDFATKQLARHLLDSSGLKDASLVVCCSYVSSDVPSDTRRAIEAAVEHLSNIITEKNCDIAVAERGLRAVAKVLGHDAPPEEEAPHDSPPTPTSKFIAKGSSWEVSYQGGPEFILTGKGAAYLHHLLQQQGRSVRATALQSGVANQPEALLRSDAASGGSNGACIKIHERHLQELQESKLIALENYDEAEIDRVDTEIAKLAQRLQSDPDVQSAQRRRKDPDKKARQAVAKAINSALQKIAREAPELAKHLEDPTLQLGRTLIYSPSEEAHWAL